MKKLTITMLAFYLFCGWNNVNAQMMNVHHPNGYNDAYDLNTIESIVFTNHTIEVNSGGCGQEIFSLFNTDFLKFGEPLLINGTAKKSGVSLYPNPVRDNMTIRKNSDRTSMAVLMNNTGTVIRTVVLADDVVTVSLESLPAGIYFISIESEYHKFIKL